MSRPLRFTSVARVARLLCPFWGALLCLVATVSTGLAGDKLLIRIATTDPATLASLRGSLDPVRVFEPTRGLDGARPRDGFALAWGDAPAVEAARRAGVPVGVRVACRAAVDSGRPSESAARTRRTAPHRAPLADLMRFRFMGKLSGVMGEAVNRAITFRQDWIDAIGAIVLDPAQME